MDWCDDLNFFFLDFLLPASRSGPLGGGMCRVVAAGDLFPTGAQIARFV